ncbi:MAG: 6-phosphogluconolactonase [Pseudomonadota bacterium]
MFLQQFFDSRTLAAEALAADICAALSSAIEERGEATLVVSGGSSPLEAFRLLSKMEFDWSLVTVVPSDERWVDVDDPASNAGMLQRDLLQWSASAARFLSLYDADVSSTDAAEAIGARVARLPRPIDYVLLGMGTDGHTASLFPDDPNIEAALASKAPCVMARPPSQPLQRISLTPRVLLDSRQIGLLFFGQDKADVFAEASIAGDLAEYPVRSVLRQEMVPVSTYFAL